MWKTVGTSLWRDLSDVHFDVMSRFIYTSDRNRYGKKEYWARPDESLGEDGKIRGDCEDMAIWCKTKCEEKGINDGRLVVCKTETGGHHCVLEVRGWILDNRHKDIKPREDLDYEWLKIKDHDGIWKEL